MSDEYPRLWVDVDGDWYTDALAEDGFCPSLRPSSRMSQSDWQPYAPFVERWKVVPADAIVIEGGGPGINEIERALIDDLRALGDQYGPLGVAKTAALMLANPPVDEAQVETMRGDIREHLGITDDTIAAGHHRPGNSGTLARALIARGWHKDADR